MNFLVDAHLPRGLCALLQAAGHEAVHTNQLPNQNRTPDQVINELSVREQRLVLRFALLEQKTQTADDLPGAFVLGHDVRKDVAQFGQVRRGLHEEALRGLGVAQDGGERLVQLVGQRAGEFAEHG